MLFISERIGKLVKELQTLIYKESVDVKEYRYRKTTEKLRNVCECDKSDWEIFSNQELWGGHREYFWFETEIMIPESFENQCVVYELKTGREGEWDAKNPQFTIFINGKRVQGLDVNHREVILCENAKAGDVYHIVLSAFTGDQNFRLQLNSWIKILDRETEKYYYDISVPYQVAQLLKKSDHEYITIIQALNNSLNLLDLRKVYSDLYYDSLKEAQTYITEEFYDKSCGNSEETIYCVGHTHIDVAWLWSLLVTEDKSVRSFSTVLELMNHYPEYQFMSSQPQLYKYVKKNAPDVYEKIKERVRENRWQPEGGMFLEADCNLSSGESLVRQLLYGTQFFKEEFGVENEILWLPDVFGYSAALPQIMEKCNIRYFMTTKISWNEMNKLPFDTFMWEGIDGTKILTHFSPARDYNKSAVEGTTERKHFTTYNAYINASQLKGAWERYSQKELNNEVMISYGYGDGGGGPTKDMLENQRRFAKGIPGCPMTKMSNPKEFFHLLEEKVSDSKYLPEWSGELYLEYHRGTYTSMARNKKYNRTSEFMNQNIESFGIMGQQWLQWNYPKQEIADIWEVILRNQFHDILPGSSIKEVYDDSKVEYETIQAQGMGLIEQSLSELTVAIQGNKGDIVVYNPNGLLEEGIVQVELPECERIVTCVVSGEEIQPVQKIAENTYLFYATEVPSKGYKTYHVSLVEGLDVPEIPTDRDKTYGTSFNESLNTSQIPSDRYTKEQLYIQSLSIGNDIIVTETSLENKYIRVIFDECGQMSSIFDKMEMREVLQDNQKGNVLMTYEDKPHNYDAWDVNNYYTEKSWEIREVESIEIVEAGPVRGTVKITRKYLDSYIEQFISIGQNSTEITVRNEIDWREKQILMKALFPVDVHTDEATFDIQYGNVKRKTHYNTSWDRARFEVCMHKWVDISEDNYGVSITNDCKYGCSVHNGIIGLSMLKSAIYPNPEADQEHHSFQYAIYPHTGDWKQAGTVRKAYRLNNPLLARVKMDDSGILEESQSFVSCSDENIIVEVIKQAEKSKDIIVRAYEYYNRRTKAVFTFAENIKSVTLCNMLEENMMELQGKGREVVVDFKPYEIVTLKVELGLVGKKILQNI